jgi:phosphatidylinositol alpha-1,6-mannosyltransferase
MSEFTKQAIMRYGIPEQKIRFLAGVEIDRFTNKGSKKATIEKYRIIGNPILLTVARLVEHKGIDTVIKALPEIITIFPSILYLVVGEGPFRRNLDNLCKRLNVERNVRFIGNIPHYMMQNKSEAFYSLCDLFIMVSRNINQIEAEGFGIVFLEAGLSKKACVGGNSGGIADAVLDGVTGRLVDPRDPQAVAETILNLLKNRKIASQMGLNGYERAIEKFDWRANVNEWERELNWLFLEHSPK